MDREATQDFLVRDILISNAGRNLTPETITEIIGTFKIEMRDGPAAWSFAECALKE